MVQMKSRSRQWLLQNKLRVFKILKTILQSSVDGQMKEKNFNTSHIQNVITKFVIKQDLSSKIKYMFMNGLESRALFDTGSKVSCMQEDLFSL